MSIRRQLLSFHGHPQCGLSLVCHACQVCLRRVAEYQVRLHTCRTTVTTAFPVDVAAKSSTRTAEYCLLFRRVLQKVLDSWNVQTCTELQRAGHYPDIYTRQCTRYLRKVSSISYISIECIILLRDVILAILCNLHMARITSTL